MTEYFLYDRNPYTNYLFGLIEGINSLRWSRKINSCLRPVEHISGSPWPCMFTKPHINVYPKEFFVSGVQT